MITKTPSKLICYNAQIISILFNAFSILFNKFSLLKLPVPVVVVGNLFFSLLISLLYYKEIKKHLSLHIFKLCLPVSLINLIGIISLYYSNSVLSPMTLGILSRFYLVFALLLSIYLLREKYTKKQLILILFSIFGCICFVLRDNIEQCHFYNVLICLLSSFCFALGYTITKIKSVILEPKIMFFYNNLIGILPVYGYFTLFGNEFTWPTSLDYIFLICAAGCFFISMMLFFKSLNFLSFGEANALRSLSPVVLSVISLPFFSEQLSCLNILGVIIMILSLFNLGRRNES